MRAVRRLTIVVGAAAAAVVLFFTLRPDEEGAAPPPEPASRTTTRAQDASARTRTQGRPRRTTATAARRVSITVREGRAVGGIRRITVRKGQRVVLLVRSDVADEVHVHGYEIRRDVGPRRPARIAFRARVPGRFEIELERRHRQIAALEVRP